jgi:hypothetical protein
VQDTSRGTPAGGPTPYSETRGYIDAHMHLMAYESLGGKARCGRPWHPYGVEYALPDCNSDPAAGAYNVALESAVGGGPADRPGRLADLQGVACLQLAVARVVLLEVARARRGRPGCART